MGERRVIRLPDRLGTRLAAAFIATALGAVGVVTAIALTATSVGVADLVAEQRAAAGEDVVVALQSAHTATGGWEDADLLAAHAVAASANAVLVVTLPAGDELAVPPGYDEMHRRLQQRGAPRQLPRMPSDIEAGDTDIADRLDLPVTIDGATVATATLLFVDRELPDPTTDLRTNLVRTLVLGAVLAALLALAITSVVTPRLTRPLRRLTDDVARLRQGERELPPTPPAPGEIGRLRAALDAMAADLERQERLRRALVADVGHELRTPVSILLGEIEALRDGIHEADADRLGSLHEEVVRIARLVEDVGSLAEAEASGFTLVRTPVDLAEVTEAALQGFATPLAAGGLTLTTDLRPAPLDGDRRRLEQVVRNLLTNAIRFAPPQTTIEVAVSSDIADAVLEVADQGPGFAPDELDHLFERFWQGTRTRGTGGSGIGLAVVAEVVRAHGGRVTASNRPEGGARMVVRLPLSVPSPTRSRVPRRSGSAPGAG